MFAGMHLFYKLLFVMVGLIITGCSLSKADMNVRESRGQTLSSEIEFKSVSGKKLQCFVNGAYIISMKKNNFEEWMVFAGKEDSSQLNKDTIDIKNLTLFPIQINLKRKIREQIEKGRVNIYSVKGSMYLQSAKKLVSGMKVRNVHAYYTYIDLICGDTIMYTHSFDTGCPSF